MVLTSACAGRELVDDDVLPLLTALETNTSFKEFYLEGKLGIALYCALQHRAGNPLGDKAATAAAKMLERNLTLKRLDLDRKYRWLIAMLSLALGHQTLALTHHRYVNRR